MKNKKFYKLLFVVIISFIFSKNVFGASFDMMLGTNKLEVEKDSNVKLNVVLKNISGIQNGLKTCEANLIYDETKMKVNAMTGLGSWTTLGKTKNGSKINFSTTGGQVVDSPIAIISVSPIEKVTISLKNIKCSDGISLYSANDNNICLTVLGLGNDDSIVSDNKDVEETVDDIEKEDTIVSDNIEQNNDYSSSITVENEKTGVYQVFIILMIVAGLSYIVKIVVDKKNLFKDI